MIYFVIPYIFPDFMFNMKKSIMNPYLEPNQYVIWYDNINLYS